MKNQSVSCLRNWCQIQIGIPACRMSSEYFMRTSLYLVRLKIFEWIKLLRRNLRQIQGNWGGRNFITASRVNSRIHYACKNAEMNLTFTTTNGFDFWILSSLMKSWGYAWPGLKIKLNLNRKVQFNCKTHCVCFLQCGLYYKCLSSVQSTLPNFVFQRKSFGIFHCFYTIRHLQ